MLQRVLWSTILATIIAWIVLRYTPASLITLPTVAFEGHGNLLATLALAALVVFLAIQLWLVWATVAAVRAYRPTPGQPTPPPPHLGAEIVWTALPIAMTLGIAWASYGLWARLFTS